MFLLILVSDGWTSGDHTIYFHGKDAVGNWGEISSLTIHIEKEWPGNWTMFGCNPQHTGYNDADSIHLPLELAWTKTFPSLGIKSGMYCK